MNTGFIRKAILECCDGTEWHLSLWFPRVTREVVGLKADAGDGDVQRELRAMLDEGVLEAGVVDGAEFEVRPFEMRDGCPDLYVRVAVAVGTLLG